ncbi:UNVERIFIED_CONTAM: hypothetical protein Slati_3457400 [Sesamum latifolium]|uniref:Uncharacterized protein n=1 Tax=Sesamum latifolium TaxID=2727402 RepID=A0AAW2UHB3_9LAMI
MVASKYVLGMFSSKPPPSQLLKLRCIQLRGGIRVVFLFGTLPSDHTTSKLEYKTRLGLGIIIVRLEASIAIAFQYQFTTTLNQEHIFSPLQVLKSALDRILERLPGACLISAHYAQSVGDIGLGTLDNILNASYG